MDDEEPDVPQGFSGRQRVQKHTTPTRFMSLQAMTQTVGRVGLGSGYGEDPCSEFGLG